MTIDLDFRAAGRSLARSPGFVAAVILSLTLGIGAGAAAFGVIDAVAAKRVSIEETVIDGFTQDGVSVASADSVRVFLQSVTVRNNAGNGLSVSGVGNWSAISGVTLVYNGTGIAASSGGIIASFKNNVFYGNKRNGAPTSLLTLKD